MLKTTELPDKLAPYKNNGSRSNSNKNNNSKPASGKNIGNGEVDKFGVGKNDVKHAQKLEKSSQSGKSKSEKTSKS